MLYSSRLKVPTNGIICSTVISSDYHYFEKYLKRIELTVKYLGIGFTTHQTNYQKFEYL